MSAYEPTPGEPYGQCLTCSAVIDSEADARQHMSETLPVASGSRESHRIRVTNPSRPERIRREIASVVDDALYDAMEALDGLTRRGMSDDEVAEALRMWPDFADAWSEHTEDGAS